MARRRSQKPVLRWSENMEAHNARREPEAFRCQVLVKDFKRLVPTLPPMAPPPREWTREERMVDRMLNPVESLLG